MKKLVAITCLCLLGAFAAYGGQDISRSDCANAKSDATIDTTVMVGVVGSYLASSRVKLLCFDAGNERIATL